jgi:hypothetical protein
MVLEAPSNMFHQKVPRSLSWCNSHVHSHYSPIIHFGFNLDWLATRNTRGRLILRTYSYSFTFIEWKGGIFFSFLFEFLLSPLFLKSNSNKAKDKLHQHERTRFLLCTHRRPLKDDTYLLCMLCNVVDVHLMPWIISRSNYTWRLNRSNLEIFYKG